MPEVEILMSDGNLKADLTIPIGSQSLILFIHGSGSNRFSSRNKYLSKIFNSNGFATMLVDLLTEREKDEDMTTHCFRFRIDLLTERLMIISKWILNHPLTKNLMIVFFSSSTGSAAAMNAAINIDKVINLISRGGRLDMVHPNTFCKIRFPVLLIVGDKDVSTIYFNKKAFNQIPKLNSKKLVIVSGASHFFEEEGKLEEVSNISLQWLKPDLQPANEEYSNKGRREQFKLTSYSFPFSLNLKFKNRSTAGGILGLVLSKYSFEDSVIMGITRGGVIVADGVIRKLPRAAFNVILSRRLVSPHDPEISIGAIAQDGTVHLNAFAQTLSIDYIEAEISKQEQNIKQEIFRYGLDNVVLDLIRKNVVIVDDGAYTGSTIIAAANWIRTYRPNKIIVALPVVPRKTKKLLSAVCDKIEFIYSPRKFKSVEDYYKDFSQVSEQEIIDLLRIRNYYQ